MTGNGAHVDLTQLLRTPAARARDRIAVTYVWPPLQQIIERRCTWQPC
ncbi:MULTISPECIES: hypothetical protein [Kitasatospora]|uniref:Uncharacterized protein n=2 Tax=Kitasatospora TaxID=2063 RepID=A0ABT1J3E3_9ACTN|nr:hypothetical protein [Kitasatospora paracochleata]MCP2311581.1 hypothetical protein [Kitasatospora paracochleata]